MLKCPYCGFVFEEPDDGEAEVSCEDCGTHPATRCPECEELIDLIYASHYRE